MITPKRLTATTYLKGIGDRTKLSACVVITPIPWIASALARTTNSKEWKANGSFIYPGIRFGKRRMDIVQCLPGASMSLITMEEAIAAGAKEFYFIGTASAVKGKIPFGQVRINDDKVSSILNPFQEHEAWKTIQSANLVDMETAYLQELSKIRKITFQHALIISDAIWKTKWHNADHTSKEYQEQITRSIQKIKNWLAQIS